MVNTKIKWTPEKVLQVINEARKVGRLSAQDKLNELQNAGPKWAVCEETAPFSGVPAKVVDTMLDVCGFANLKISARGKFFQIAKHLSQSNEYRFYCTNAYRGGGMLSIFDSTNRQELSVNKASAEGHARVLQAYGLEARVESRID